jgi:hypothetical protein
MSDCEHVKCVLRHPHDGPAVLPEAQSTCEITVLSDRAIAEETLYWMRTAGQAIAEFQKVGAGGLIKAMMSGKKG